MLNNFRTESKSHLFYTSSSSEEEIRDVAIVSPLHLLQNEIMAVCRLEQQPASVLEASLEKYCKLDSSFRQQIDGASICLSKSAAQDLIDKLVGTKCFKMLSRMNVLFVQLLSLVQNLRRDVELNQCTLFALTGGAKREKIAVKDVLINFFEEIHKLHRNLRECAPLYQGEMQEKGSAIKLILVRANFRELLSLHTYLQDAGATIESQKTKRLMQNLKVFIEVLHYVCYHEDFLKHNLQSISQYDSVEMSVFLHPPTLAHHEFYMDALGICLSALTHLQRSMQTTFFIPIKESIDKLRSMDVCKTTAALEVVTPLIKVLEELLEWIQSSYQRLTQPLQQLVVAAKMDASNTLLEVCFKNYHTKTLCKGVFVQQADLIAKVNKPWNAFKEQHLSPQQMDDIATTWLSMQEKVRVARKAICQAGIEQGRKGLALKSVLDAIEKKILAKDLGALYNVYFIEPMRMPLLSFQEIACYGAQLESFLHATAQLHAALLVGRSQSICSAFCTFDLLWHTTEEFCASLPVNAPKSSAYIKKTQEAFRHLAEIALFPDQCLMGEHDSVDKSICQLHAWAKASGEYIEDENINGHFKTIIHHLNVFLAHFVPHHTSRMAVLEVLFTGLSQRDQLEAIDLPILKNHFRLLVDPSHRHLISSGFDKLYKYVQEKYLQLSDLPSQSFWRFNLESIKLAQSEFARLWSNMQNCQKQLQTCETVDDALRLLHAWNSRQMKRLRRFKFCLEQISVFRNQQSAVMQDVAALFHDQVSVAWEKIQFLTLSMVDVLRSNPQPISPLKMPADLTEDILWDEVDPVASDEKPESPTLPSNHSFSRESNMDNWQESELLQHIAKMPLKLLSTEESCESYIFRSSKRQELLSSVHFYLSLLDEQTLLQQLQPEQAQLFLARGQADYLLLLEATEKVALCSLSIGAKNQHDYHIACTNFENRPILYTHDGMHLIRCLKQAHFTWPQVNELTEIIKAQSPFLKEAYWFHTATPMLPRLHAVRASCKAVWMDLCRQLACETSTSFQAAAALYGSCRKNLHKFQRCEPKPIFMADGNQLIPFQLSLKHFLSAGKWVDSCNAIVERNRQAIERLLVHFQILQACNKNLVPPLNFVARAIEFEVGVLSMSLQLALSCYGGGIEFGSPLLLDEFGIDHGRPMFLCHGVDKLWCVLKPHLDGKMDPETLALMDSSLPLFVGDPRYPFPNKTPLTDTLIKLQSKVYLYQKMAKKELFYKSDMKLLKRHLRLEGKSFHAAEYMQMLSSQISSEIERATHNMSLALYLSTELLILGAA